MRFAFLILGASIMLSGCMSAAAVLGSKAYVDGATSRAERKAASAAAIGQDLDGNSIKIKDVDRGDTEDSWTAETAIGNFRCTQLKGRRTATCSKR